eukprot:TRINITY_DN1879_c0_g3_i4.p1 TRINITY_DN1879_c0_g3~~TRINITY_DN1879_c0_g3_i4.p1  ORF type:complete len:618 (-),score=166.66 TRINITY_DN1879_c0_g3_i4:252-2009(-)
MSTIEYTLSDFPSPVVSGFSLKLFAWSTESSVTIRESVISQAGIHKIREFVPPLTLHGKKVRFDPTLAPLVHPSKEDLARSTPTKEDLQEILMNRPHLEKSDFEFLSIGQLYQEYLNQTLTPLIIAERIESILKQSNEGPTPLKLLISHSAEHFLQQARESTQRYQDGNPLSFLDGIPVVIKDELDMVPYPTTGGTKFVKEPATKDSSLVRKPREMGALLIGKSNMHEIGIGVTGVNVHYGTVRNPYNINHMTGGSSSGSSAAVASGVSVFSIGTDGGGSIRVPASFCGLFGLKATFGRISGGSGFASCPAVCHVGPICGSARDLAATYVVLSGKDDSEEFTTHIQPPVSLHKFNEVQDLSDVRIGLYDPYFRHADPEVVDTCQKFVDQLVARGATIVPIEIAYLEEAKAAHLVTIVSEMATLIKGFMAQDPNRLYDLSLTTRIPIALAENFKSTDFVLAQKFRTLMMEQFKTLFERVDVIVTPTCGRTAPELNETMLESDEWNTFDTVKIMRFAALTNLTGNPSITFPAGYSEEGLPIGIQFTSNWWNEDVLLRLAHVSEYLVKKRTPATYFALTKSRKLTSEK